MLARIQMNTHLLVDKLNELFIHVFNHKGGPMVEGIPPREASDRLNIFQSKFDELWRKFQTYSDGEDLFGLAVTDYSDLQRIRKELNLAQKLYGLYNAVMDSVDGYYDILWSEVDIEKINNELLDFQNKFVIIMHIFFIACVKLQVSQVTKGAKGLASF